MATIPTLEYADYIYAAAYFGERVGADDWATFSQDNRTKALKHATRLIDRLDLVLEKTDEAQNNEFPRGGDTLVPEEVRMATCEQALELLRGSLPENRIASANVASESIGDASRSYTDGAASVIGVSSGLTSTAAAQLLREWINDPNEITLVRES